MNELLKTILPSLIALLGTIITGYFAWRLAQDRIKFDKELARFEQIKSAYDEIFKKINGLNEKVSDLAIGLVNWKKSLKAIESFISEKSIHIENDDEKLLKKYLKSAENLKILLNKSNNKITSEIESLKEQVTKEFNTIRGRFRRILESSNNKNLQLSTLRFLPLIIGIGIIVSGVSLFLFLQGTQAVIIDNPKNLEVINVETDNGAAIILVDGKSFNVFGSKSHIYVSTFVEKPYQSEAYWFQIAEAMSDGSWKTVVYPGSSDRPLTKDGKTLLIQAFVATDEQINEEIKLHPNENFVTDLTKFQIRSNTVRITIFPIKISR